MVKMTLKGLFIASLLTISAVAQNCSHPPLNECNIMLTSTAPYYSAGDMAMYMCFPGYRIEGSNNVMTAQLECQAQNATFAKWSPEEVPKCELKTCGCPENGTNTSPVLSKADLLVGDKYSYSCLPGYGTSDSLVVECTIYGNFSLPPPNCTAVTCGTPGNGDNTEMVPNLPLVPGEAYMYVCDPGYAPDGDMTTVCLADGTFSLAPPSCSKIVCGSPPDGYNTVPVPAYTNLTFLEEYVYECTPGYFTNDSTCTVCLENGQFSLASPPNCTAGPVCSTPLNGTNTVPVPSGLTLSTFESYTYQCLPGYATIDERCTLCLANGQLSLTAPPACTEVPVIACDTPAPGIMTTPVPAGLILNPLDYFIYSCMFGYETDDELVTVCLLDSTLSLRSPPNCTAITCMPPPNGVNTVPVPQDTYTFGQVYQYECRDGYFPTSQLINTTCQSDGFWSTPPLECFANISCGLPPEGSYTKPVPGNVSTALGSVYEYQCLHGFVPTLNSTNLTTVCDVHGWTLSPPPQCTKECTYLIDIKFEIIPGTGCTEGYVSSQSLGFGSEFARCDSGEAISFSTCSCTDTPSCCPVP